MRKFGTHGGQVSALGGAAKRLEKDPGTILSVPKRAGCWEYYPKRRLERLPMEPAA